MDLVHDDEYGVEDLQEFLGPVYEYIQSPTFISNLGQVIEIILEDRDGNNKFTIDDLKLLKDDILGITTLVNSVLLVIGSIPQLRLRYESDATEELVFKVFAYIFLVVVPDKTGKKWTTEEKESVVDLTLAIYNIVVSSQVTQDLVKQIAAWFKRKGWCQCMSAEPNKEDIVREKMPKIKAELRSSVQRNKEMASLRAELNELRAEVGKTKTSKVDLGDVALDISPVQSPSPNSKKGKKSRKSKN